MVSNFINTLWDESITSTLMDYIKIPNKSPLFDRDWKKHGHMDAAVKLIVDWCRVHAVDGMQLDVVELPGRTPVILMEIPGSSDQTILLYGHLDKQPEMTGWDSDLHPWKPVLRGDRLYGRGGADDGYAAFASLTAIRALREKNLPHARCVILIEACEESGSVDLPYYIDALQNRIGTPDLVICLDSGCGNYDQLWMTTSLRGMVTGELSIEVLTEGVHSGNGSGIVPSCFMVLRQLLNRIEDPNTGQILLPELQVTIPDERLKQTTLAADALGNQVYTEFPFVEHVQPVTDNLSELILNRTWRPALSVIGANGLPPPENAGSVTLPKLTFPLSMRIPPMCDPKHAAAALKQTLENNPPFQAKIHFEIGKQTAGWNAPEQATWLHTIADTASQKYFGSPAMYMGEGGTIPFMGMLGKKFPRAQFLITGVLGPHSNAHGPNEFLHLLTAKKLTACVADVISTQYVSS
ncbi:MAG: M20 family metallopeptidase [Gammaproteobacteria bacterium]|nr:M20 family metallopeptidase [Gammaproteobacteria bacterium]